MGNNKTSFSKFPSSKTLTVDVKKLSGVDFSLPKNKIADNELSDCVNFYLKDGYLSLRPGIEKVVDFDSENIIDIYPKNGNDFCVNTILPCDDNSTTVSGAFILTTSKIIFFDGEVFTELALPDGESMSFSSGVFFQSGTTSESEIKKGTTTYVGNGQDIILVTPNNFYKITSELTLGTDGIITPQFVITVAEPTIPVLYEECDASGDGTAVGSHNILTTRCIQKFNTDSSSLKYILSDTNLDDNYIEVEYWDENLVDYQIMFVDNDVAMLTDDIKATINRKKGILTISGALVDSEANNLSNNLVVSYSVDNPLLSSLKACSLSSWFNGGSKSQYGSGRVFLSGSTKNINRVYYSYPTDPLYFEDDCYFDVGLTNEKVTALKPYNNTLMIFSEDSIFSLSYSEKLTGEDFVVKEINSEFGCSYKDTLNLLNDKLIFLCEDSVYMLDKSFKLSKVSTKVEAKIEYLNEEDLTPSSVVDDDYYFLMFSKTILVLDTEDCSKVDDYSWFIFELTDEMRSILKFKDEILMFSNNNVVAKFNDELTSDYDIPFDAYFETKTFNFSLVDYYKRLTAIMLSLKLTGDNSNFDFSIIRDSVTTSQTLEVSSSDNSEQSISLTPDFKNALELSLKFARDTSSLEKIYFGGFSVEAIKTFKKR